jgi:L-ascorbate metabolism protein UlaG (beta-lactamase superfamily)
MTVRNLYLKPNVLVEPLFNQWYAWSNLIAPATSSMYVANLHLKIMQSFVTSPQLHAAALKNPANLGGPYINYGTDRVNEIKTLLERTQKEQAHVIEFAEAIKALDNTLTEEANGLSLEPLYQKVPEPLQGYVELVYDLNHSSSMRFIEGFLYHSRYCNTASQSIALSLTDHDDRSFVFSTPRLERANWLNLQIPFHHEGLDVLFNMKRVPRPFEEVAEMLAINKEHAGLFSTFFTEEPPQLNTCYSGDDVRIRYLGHACVLFETKETSVLCDPVVSYDIESAVPRYTYADLPDSIDYVVITHNHQDHCMFETLLQLRHKIKQILVPKNNGGWLADPSMKLVLQHLGFDNIREIDETEVVRIPGGSITGLPFFGEHADLHIRTKMAYAIELHGKTALLVADSENLEPKLYDHIRHCIGDVVVLFIGMECDGAPLSWLYGPLLTKPLARKVDQSRRSNGSDFPKALSIVDKLGPQQVYVYAMGQEPWLTYLTSLQYTPDSRPIVESDKLVEECRRRGLVSERLFGRKEIVLAARD